MKEKKIYLISCIFLIFNFLFFSLVLNSLVSAQNIVVNRETNREYTLNNDKLSVKETRKISIVDKNWKIGSGSVIRFVILNPVDAFDNNLIEDTIASIRIDSVNNSARVSNIDNSDLSQIIIEVLIQNEITYDTPFEVSISYIAHGLSSKSGLVYDIYIPGFSPEYNFETSTSKEKISTQLKIPKSIGEINFISLNHNLTEDSDYIYINFSTETLIGQTAWIQVGKEQIYSFNLTQIVPKTLDLPFGINIAKIVLPRNVTGRGFSQEVYFKDISPTPLYVEQDTEGNIFASFAVKSNSETKIEISGFAKVKIIDEKPNFSNDSLQNSQKYLLSGKYWESDHPDIKAFAEFVRQKASDDTELLSQLYKEVISRIDYSTVKKYGLNERQGALATLRGAAAVCMEYSDLFIATARALGIPARAAFGYGYSTLADPNSGQNIEPHQWAEVFWNGEWVAVDTTWGESGREIIGGNLNHFYIHSAYENPNDPTPFQLSAFGHSSNLPTEVYKVIAIESLENENLLTVDKVLQLYTRKNDLVENQLVLSFIDLYDSIDIQANEFLKKHFGITLPIHTFILVILLLFLIIIIHKKKYIKLSV